MAFDIKIVVHLEPCSTFVSGFTLDLRTSNNVTEVSSNGQALKSANIWAVKISANSIGTGHPKRVIILGVDEQIECVLMIQNDQGIPDVVKMTQNDPDTTTKSLQILEELRAPRDPPHKITFGIAFLDGTFSGGVSFFFQSCTFSPSGAFRYKLVGECENI